MSTDEDQYLKHISAAIGKKFRGMDGIVMTVLSCVPSRSGRTLVVKAFAESQYGKVMRTHGGTWFDRWLYQATEI